MPGAYPEWLLDTPEKRDRFWNLRLGNMTAPFPAMLVMLLLASSVKTLTVAAVVYVLTHYLWVKFVFAYNIFGRLMASITWLNEEN